jgi:hypothetical protein
MVKQVTFQTDGSATSGTGTEELTGETFFYSPGMAIRDIFQTSSGTKANDADWALYVDGVQTRYGWTAEELNPANVGRSKILEISPIRIRPGALVQLKWSGQATAAANKLRILYDNA